MQRVIAGAIGVGFVAFFISTFRTTRRYRRQAEAHIKEAADRAARLAEAYVVGDVLQQAFEADNGNAALQAAAQVPSGPVSLLRWSNLKLSGPPRLAELTKTIGTGLNDERTKRGPGRFASVPLTVLATGDARVATDKRSKRCFMLHSVIEAATPMLLHDVLMEAAELRKMKHPSLLRVLAVVTDQPSGEV